MAQCEACMGVATKTCGYDNQPMLNFCVQDYIIHLRKVHPFNEFAQAEANELSKCGSRHTKAIESCIALLSFNENDLVTEAREELAALKAHAPEPENARIDRLEAKLGQAALEVARLTTERDEARAALKILLDYMDSGAIVLINGEGSIDIDQTFRSAIDEIIGPDEIVRGTICGTLEKLNLHNTTRFYIFPPIGPKQVACDFGPTLREAVIKAVDKYVCVSGGLRYKRLEQFPYAVNAEDIDILPPDDELPTLFDIRGMAPELTGGRSTKDFLEEIRDGEER